MWDTGFGNRAAEPADVMEECMAKSEEDILQEQLASADIVNHIADGVYVLDTHRRITHWNRAAERITGFSADEVKGRCCADNLLTHTNNDGQSLCRGNCPVAKTLVDGKVREAVVNLHHKDGHRVPVQVSVSPVLDNKGEVIGAVETFRECSDVIAMRSTIERLKHWGCVDPQSGLATRRIVEGRLAERQQEMQRYGWPFGVLLVEVDMLPEVRQTFGDEGVSQAIRMAALCVTNSLRSLDTIGRWDERTFLAVVANATVAELTTIAERVRSMVDSAYRILDNGEMHVTASIGAAAADPRDNTASLLLKAEKCLYASRSAGRNRVTVHGAPAAQAGQ